MSEHLSTDKSLHREAPLVHLILTSLDSLEGVELEKHLQELRDARSSPATTRAKTERKPTKAKAQNINLKGML